MKKKDEILLSSNFTNNLKIDGELGWFLKENNPASTGYTWKCRPDNSGVYEQVEEITLHPSTGKGVGVPGAIIWKFKALRKGTGNIRFELYISSQEEPVEIVYVTIEV